MVSQSIFDITGLLETSFFIAINLPTVEQVACQASVIYRLRLVVRLL
jgi:hypothetical protein